VFVGTQIRRVVGGDGDRFDMLFAAAEPTDRPVELRLELALPLLEEVDRRNDHERRGVEVGHPTDGDDGFAAPGGEFDDAAVAGVVPGSECVALVVPEFVPRAEVLDRWREDPLVQREAPVQAGLAEDGVPESRRAVALRALVVADERQPLERGRLGAVDADGALVVAEADHGRHRRAGGLYPSPDGFLNSYWRGPALPAHERRG